MFSISYWSTKLEKDRRRWALTSTISVVKIQNSGSTQVESPAWLRATGWRPDLLTSSPGLFFGTVVVEDSVTASVWVGCLQIWSRSLPMPGWWCRFPIHTLNEPQPAYQWNSPTGRSGRRQRSLMSSDDWYELPWDFQRSKQKIFSLGETVIMDFIPPAQSINCRGFTYWRS